MNTGLSAGSVEITYRERRSIVTSGDRCAYSKIFMSPVRRYEPRTNLIV